MKILWQSRPSSKSSRSNCSGDSPLRGQSLKPKTSRSLQACALALLAQREQSCAELRRKLLSHALAQDAADPRAHSAASELTPSKRVESVLEWLQAHGLLSEERFIESRIHARAGRFGNLRIRQELNQHQLTLEPEVAQALRDSELQRACSVRERKFAHPPATLAERARQARFLASRGFSPEVIGRSLRLAGQAPGDSRNSGLERE
jgi:regulatory protein